MRAPVRAYVDPLPTTLSRAMFRVGHALRRYAPVDRVVIVDDPRFADVQVLHTIGPDVREHHLAAPEYAIIQYCFWTGAVQPWLWSDLWGRARLVWSYYDLAPHMPPGGHFYFAPLGVDGRTFHPDDCPADRDIGVMTSGYVTGPGAEAIEEVALAADAVGLSVVHLGPANVEGMVTRPRNWGAILGVTDAVLAAHYRRARWVSGLRHVEGFELPVLEGLASGCRPIVFDRPDMRQWYGDHAVFVPDCCGDELIAHLIRVLSVPPAPVTPAERDVVLTRFDWAAVARGFWEALLLEMLHA